MERTEFNRDYNIVYKDFFSTTDQETGERIMLLRSQIFLNTNLIEPDKMVVEKVVLDTDTLDFKMQNGEEAFQNMLVDRMNLKIDLTYNIED